MPKLSSPTSIDYAILGLIAQQAQTGYAIRKIFETTAMGNYSSSPGTIYPALKRLQKLGMVEKKKEKEGGKEKFHLTSLGRATLLEWLNQPIGIDDVKKRLDELFLRFAFLDIVADKNKSIAFVETFAKALSTYIKELELFHNQQAANLPLHGKLAFEYGLDSYKMTLKWCKSTLKSLTKP